MGVETLGRLVVYQPNDVAMLHILDPSDFFSIFLVNSPPVVVITVWV